MSYCWNGSPILRSGCLLFLTCILGACLQSRLSAATPSSAADPDSCLIVYFGDSITEGWMDGVLHASLAYPAICDSLLHSLNVRCRSMRSARGGTTTEDALRSLQSGVLDHSPRIVVIAFGTNDWYIHGYETRPRVGSGDFRRNVRLLIEAVRSVGAHPVLLGLPPIIASRFHAYSPAYLYAPFAGVDSLRADYDRMLEQAASDAGIPYVAVQFNVDVLPLAQGMDGVHPTVLGHARIAEALAAVLAREAVRVPEPRRVPLFDVRAYPQPLHARRGSLLSIEVDLTDAVPLVIAYHDATGRRVSEEVMRAGHVGTNYFFLQPPTGEGTLPGAGAYFMHVRAGRHDRVVPLIIQ